MPGNGDGRAVGRGLKDSAALMTHRTSASCQKFLIASGRVEERKVLVVRWWVLAELGG